MNRDFCPSICIGNIGSHLTIGRFQSDGKLIRSFHFYQNTLPRLQIYLVLRAVVQIFTQVICAFVTVFSVFIKEDRSAQQCGITICIRCCKQDVTHFLEGRSHFISICAGYCTVCLLLCGKRIVNTDAVQIIRASAVRCRDNCQLHFVFPVLICCK